jgi:hypothetical protein
MAYVFTETINTEHMAYVFTETINTEHMAYVFFRNACTKSGSLRFSQFSGC